MKGFLLGDSDFRIYQPLFRERVAGFEQQMLFSPVQMRCYQFFMPEDYLDKGEFGCVPDGCVDVAFIYGENDYCVELIGSPIRKKALRCYPGRHYFGVRFAPGFCLGLGDFSLAELADNEIVFTSADLRVDCFVEALKRPLAFSEKIGLFLKTFAPYITDMSMSPAAYGAIQSINRSKGGVSVAELSSELCYSERQLGRLLGVGVGLGPKMLCRIVRCQNAIHNIITNPNLDNAMYMEGLSYSDQAHFQREFKEFTGLTPQEMGRSFLRMPAGGG